MRRALEAVLFTKPEEDDAGEQDESSVSSTNSAAAAARDTTTTTAAPKVKYSVRLNATASTSSGSSCASNVTRR